MTEPRVATFSAHCAANFFSKREVSDLDVELAAGATDDEYLATVERALRPFLADHFGAEDGGEAAAGGGGGDDGAAAAADDDGVERLVFYQAGVDPLAADRLGKLSLTRDGLRRRDALVFALALRHGARLVVTMGGGYPKELAPSSPSFQEVVAAHADVYVGAAQALARHYERTSGAAPPLGRIAG